MKSTLPVGVKPNVIRRLIDKLGVTQIEAAKLIGVGARTMRTYCALGAPKKIELALRQCLAQKEKK